MPQSSARRWLLWLTFPIAAIALFDGAIFYSRWSASRAFEQRRNAKEVEQARKVVENLGGDSLKILSFYASPGVVRPGETSSVCYGVNAAKTVRLEPAGEDVYPALAHCVQVSPRKDTEYKLTAEDAAGHAVSQSFVLRVVPGAGH